jgi:hypothetical protein
LEHTQQLQIDHALRVGDALTSDSLHRIPFARSVTDVLKKVTNESGLVVSLEGSWGSGKSSVLAMVEELLQELPPDERPVVVHFNPWLIGDRDALLRQFLSSMTKQVRLADHAKDGKKVAKELKTYAKAFDILKFIPGAEPWVTMVKSVVESMGETVDSVAEYKTPDIEERKLALEKALRKYSRRIVVLIDDIDRLFPNEVFEMVRIIKAVGDLPNVGYVLAWDSAYVSAALEKLTVPFASTYLDKVVQVRLPIPSLSFSKRIELMNKSLRQLPEDAHKIYFPNNDDRFAMLFHSGLSELMETPRDIIRLHDVVSTIEPGLRGEVHLADIIGLACLMTKAPAVYRLLQQCPQAFVGKTPGSRSDFGQPEQIVQGYAVQREAAFKESSQKNALLEMVHWLFPLVPTDEDEGSSGKGTVTEGHLAHPERLLVALQLSMHPNDLSLVQVQQFLTQPARRSSISEGLDEENCTDFLNALNALSKDALPTDVVDLSIAVARLVDNGAFSRRARNGANIWETRASRNAIDTMQKLTKDESDEALAVLTKKLIADPIALSVAAELAFCSYGNSDADWRFKAADDSRSDALATLVNNVKASFTDGTFYDKSSAEMILWTLSQLTPSDCAAIFDVSLAFDPTADRFVETYLRAGVDSFKGQIYALPSNSQTLEAFVTLTDLRRRAEQRIQDATMELPTRAAWLAILNGGKFYGRDGSPAER